MNFKPNHIPLSAEERRQFCVDYVEWKGYTAVEIIMKTGRNIPSVRNRNLNLCFDIPKMSLAAAFKLIDKTCFPIVEEVKPNFKIDEDKLFLYYVGGDGLFKIGVSKNIKERLNALRTEAGLDKYFFLFVGKKDCILSIEKYIKKAFKRARAKESKFKTETFVKDISESPKFKKAVEELERAKFSDYI